jgi:hypothetical protein
MKKNETRVSELSLDRFAVANGCVARASRRNDLSLPYDAEAGSGRFEKFAMARTPSPARETRALPRTVATRFS